MARIRIIDEWLRSPISAPARQRAVMVVATQWAEQRVLMRAYAGCTDQTRPTIVLHGAELMIGPAGTDASGPWGIHVDLAHDGRAQELRAQLELAARRLAGSKGNPPRLVDEAPEFEMKVTNQWSPGAPRDLPGQVATSAAHHGVVSSASPHALGSASTNVFSSAAPPAVAGPTAWAPAAEVRPRRPTPIPQAWLTDPPGPGWPPAQMASRAAASSSLGATTALGVPLFPPAPAPPP